jgi:hypothetical protein
MIIDRDDVRLANGVAPELSRPTLTCVMVKKGRMIAADGFMLVSHTTRLEQGEKESDKEVLIPGSLIKQIVPRSVGGVARIKVNGTGEISYLSKGVSGTKLMFDPPTGSFAKIPELLAGIPTEKKFEVALSASLLKKLCSCLPANAQIRFGFTASDKAVEFDVPNSDRKIKGILMPMFIQHGAPWPRWAGDPEVKDEHSATAADGLQG